MMAAAEPVVVEVEGGVVAHAIGTLPGGVAARAQPLSDASLPPRKKKAPGTREEEREPG